jgi:hypothetical protein
LAGVFIERETDLGCYQSDVILIAYGVEKKLAV